MTLLLYLLGGFFIIPFSFPYVVWIYYLLTTQFQTKRTTKIEKEKTHPKNKPQPLTKSIIEELQIYEKKYVEKYNLLKEKHNESRIEELYESCCTIHLNELQKEYEQIQKKENELSIFSSSLEQNKETLCNFILNNTMWQEFNKNYQNTTAEQMYEMLDIFESYFYETLWEKVVQHTHTPQEQEQEQEQQEPFFDFESIYPNECIPTKENDQPEKEENDEEEKEENDENEKEEDEMDENEINKRVEEEMKKNTTYGYMRLYFYELLLKDIEYRKWEIEKAKTERTGFIHENLKKEAKEKYFHEKHKNLERSLLFESTPLGNVIMNYNIEKNGFFYYSDKTIPYLILNAIARKYVVINDCKELYVEIENEFVEMLDKDTEASKKKRSMAPIMVTDTGKIVVPKNRDSNQQMHEEALKRNNIKSWSQSSSVKASEESLSKYKNKINIFVQKGKIADVVFLQKIDRKTTNKKLKMSFAEFKSMYKKIPGTIGNDNSEIKNFIQTHSSE